MSLLQMSIYGSVMILIIAMIRMFSVSRLPKKTFLVLWWIVIIRLLIPFTLPSNFSAYSMFNISEALQNVKIIESFSDGNMLNQKLLTNVAYRNNLDLKFGDFTRMLGTILVALYFIVSYFKSRREFQMSLPITNEFITNWKRSQKIRRTITVRQLSNIKVPLTYGIFRPVILLPKASDWQDTRSINYILLHEYIHIRHLDIITKFILITTLCVHWFNPCVWLLYILMNQDLELSCDEEVVHTLGVKIKAEYAGVLINMAAKQSGLTPLCSSFSKNANEERITAIMKMKNPTTKYVLLGAVLVVTVTLLWGTTMPLEAKVSKGSSGELQTIEDNTSAISVFFDEEVEETRKKEIEDLINKRIEVDATKTKFVTGDEAWEEFKADNLEIAEEYASNPLEGSDHFRIYLKESSMQKDLVTYLLSIEGIRKVNHLALEDNNEISVDN